MRVATWNINGLRARLDFVRHWLESRRPDVVGLQELKMEDGKFPHAVFEAMEAVSAGGWRIIKTLGHKMVHLYPVNGFAAETSSAVIIGLASHFGIPVSTTHNVSAAIMGVGAAKRCSALKWTIVERMAWAWLLTIPVAAMIAYWLMRILQTVGYVIEV